MRATAVPFGILVALILGVATIRVSSLAVAANPPGNNGTIKVDGLAFDDAPDNEPHPGCIFQIDFYGYDEGDLLANVEFRAIEPTGSGQTLLADSVFIGQDDNAGGGSEAGLDASRTYDLTTGLTGVTPQPQQGYHIKLRVDADGSHGADTKFKVFWVQPCQPGPPPIVPESPLPVLLPISAAGLSLVVLALLRRREPRVRAPADERRG